RLARVSGARGPDRVRRRAGAHAPRRRAAVADRASLARRSRLITARLARIAAPRAGAPRALRGGMFKHLSLAALVLPACLGNEPVSSTSQLEAGGDCPVNTPAAIAPAA